MSQCENWSEIAAHLGVSVRTAQHYEFTMGLPVRRVAGRQRGSVRADREDLSRWMAQMGLSHDQFPKKELGTPVDLRTPEFLPPIDRDRQIRRILNSDRFQRSPRSSELLEFLILKSGPGRPVKELTIGIEVFGSDYDPEKHAQVRVSIHQLRQMLDQYYLHEGIHDGVVVSIPNGRYELQFQEKVSSNAPARIGVPNEEATPRTSFPDDKNPEAESQLEEDQRSAVLEHLDRLLTSVSFAAAPSLKRLLTFIVQASLAGQRVSEYDIAHQVFFRPDHDPLVDTTVRTTMSRLRQKLEAYYSQIDSSQPIRFCLDRHGYRAYFLRKLP